MTGLITLIPESGIHFWDVDLDLDALPRLSRRFWEERLAQQADESGEVPVALRELATDAEGEFVDPLSGIRPPEEQCYTVSAARALEPFLAKWVPLPVLTVLQPRANLPDLVDRGPSNWVRARLVELPPDPRGRMARPARLTLAFDTALEPPDPDRPGMPLAPSERTVTSGQEMAMVADTARNSWFLNEEWVGAWLLEMLRELRQAQLRGRPLRAEDMPWACEHQARYILFLALLEASGVVPRVRFVDTLSRAADIRPVEVHLVLDIGNSRTCGLLVEEHPGEGMNLSNAMRLVLRDLTEPERTYSDPFESRVEFVRANLGREAVSRRSGRPGAFAWPSPVRVGPEAVRLAGARVANLGATGISSPKRYLWDQRRVVQPWRFNGRGAGTGEATDPPVSGRFMRLVTEEGEVRSVRGTGVPAVWAHFSRSSLFSFMVAEIVLQALAQANAPGVRAMRQHADVPRRLARLVLTMPPGMPLAEQRILRARAQAGVRLAWEMLGWSANRAATHPLMREPAVVADLDEATATQIVWLHNEIAERMGGDAPALFDVLGAAPEEGRPLRVASIDVGGGTTDLMVVSYRLGEGDAVLPTQEFRESFKVAGDDLLRQMLAEVVVPALAASLKQAGVADPMALLRRALGGDQGGQSEEERHLRRQFVAQVLEPVGIEVLHARERTEGRAQGVLLQRRIGEVLGPVTPGLARALAYLERQAQEAGAREDGAVLRTEVVATVQQVDRLVRSTLGPVLSNLCEAAWHLGCDVMLLSGRPSRLDPVADIVTARLPVPPHRVVRMHRYRVSERYPFRDPSNRIDDPKTTAAVGAMLAIQAERQLRNFHLNAGAFGMKSTARYIGRLDQSGQLRDGAVLLRDLDLDGRAAAARDGGVSFVTALGAATLLGFRQLPIERWTAQPLYALELAEAGRTARLALPLRVTVRRQDDAVPGAEEDQDGLVREMFAVEEVADANGDPVPAGRGAVAMRLQTMDRAEGYWRDTGNLELRGVGA